ncbi:hypothetical protein NPX13_g4353 [Xylaria arbuscula]|uniref:Uncharacterized protein n=1 Tax=Xylaria arbuscula TaxID=114810 RepID=A0A9W8NFN2_9PEZI|nr:hypothetical protein NPX13_g4353 [Xylaria arbuscula]
MSINREGKGRPSWSVGLDDEDFRESDTITSNANTSSIDFAKPLPPIPQTKQHGVDESYDLQMTRADEAQRASQLRSAKDLRRTQHQHPEILRPGTTSQAAFSCPEIANEQHPEILRPGIVSTPASHKSRVGHYLSAITSSPFQITTRCNTHSSEAEPCLRSEPTTPIENRNEFTPDHSSRPRFVPRKPSYVQAFIEQEPSPGATSTYSAYRPSEPLRPGNQAVRPSDRIDETRRPTESTSSRQRSNAVSSSSAVTFVDGVLFEMVSPPPAPSSSAPPDRGRPTYTSPRTRSRSPSPAYGAFVKDWPRQTRRSFFERTQARIESSVNERLVKAGLRPPPSFKVLKVEKSPTSTSSMIEEQQKRINATPSLSTEAAWQARIERLQRRGEQQQLTVPPFRQLKDQRKPSWDISSDEDEAQVSSSAPAQHIRKRPNLHTNLAPPGITEFQGLNKTSPMDISNAKDFADSHSRNASDDSLFLNLDPDKNNTQNPESTSFFASDYSRKQLAASEEKYQIIPAESHGEQEEKETELIKANPSTCLSQDQPSPIDDRRGLPSQAQRRTLVKKKGMHLRQTTD